MMKSTIGNKVYGKYTTVMIEKVSWFWTIKLTFLLSNASLSEAAEVDETEGDGGKLTWRVKGNRNCIDVDEV